MPPASWQDSGIRWNFNRGGFVITNRVVKTSAFDIRGCYASLSRKIAAQSTDAVGDTGDCDRLSAADHRVAGTAARCGSGRGAIRAQADLIAADLAGFAA